MDHTNGASSKPDLLLREHLNSNAAFITFSSPEDYSGLEAFAFKHFDRNQDEFMLHFHFHGFANCVTKAKPLLWDAGVYLNEKLVKDGVIRLEAHFVKKTWFPGPKKRRLPTFMDNPRKRKRAKSPVPEGNVAVQDNMTALRKKLRPKLKVPLVTPPDYPRLTLTYENWYADHQYWLTHNAPANDPTHRETWSIDFTQGYRSSIAHTRLISGRYGVVAQNPCQTCAKKGLECRVYHPEMGKLLFPGNPENYLGKNCAGCRSSHSKMFCEAHWHSNGGGEGDEHFVYCVVGKETRSNSPEDVSEH